MRKRQQKKAFTLIELMISVFIFLLIMTATVTIFTREITAYRVARETQKNLENAQFTLNFMSKVLRTSEVNDISSTEVYAYDHSQNKCFVFKFEGDQLTMNKQLDGTTMLAGDCVDNDDFPSGKMQTTAISLTIGKVTGSFGGKESRDGTESGFDDVDDVNVGAVTTMLVIEPSGGARDNLGNAEKVYIQSTSSLRDYTKAGLAL